MTPILPYTGPRRAYWLNTILKNIFFLSENINCPTKWGHGRETSLKEDTTIWN